MTITSISTASIQQTLAAQLEAQQSSASLLTQQLSTSQKYTNLTDYSPSDALNLMNLQSSATQKQAYLSVIGTVQTRLSGYDTTMTDMESIVSQAQTLSAGNQNYNASTVASIAATANNYLESVTVDLNQQIGGRYIYSGSRYDTAPVSNLATLSGSPSTTVYTDGATLPAYDTAYSAGTVSFSTSGQAVTVGGTITAGQSASITVNGKTYSYTEQAGDTVDSVATSLAALVNADVSGTTATNGVITVGASGAIDSTSSGTTSTAAYATDSANIDTGFSVNYGVSADNPAFQQLVAGLRYLQAAGNSTDSTTYQANMSQATSLLTTAMSSLQAVHTSVADNINTLTNETTTQNTAISNLTTQLDNIQQVNVTQVATELTALETQLQASYSATGTLEKMSIVNYL